MTKRKQKRKHPGRTGRPVSSGTGAPIMVRMHPPQIARIDAWLGDAPITRAEGIRQLLDWALDCITGPAQPGTSNTRSQALPPL